MGVVAVGKYSNNELRVFSYLTDTMLLNTAAACGVMANIYYETRFNHLAEGDKVGESYTSFGLCQWHKSRKTNLINYCQRKGVDYKSVSGQMSFLHYELSTSYSTLLEILRKVPNNAEGAYQAASQMCARFEVPSGYGEWVNGNLILGITSITRGNFAKDTYWNAYKDGADIPAGLNYSSQYGNKIVEIARSKLGKPYDSVDRYGPDSFDSAGFVYYCYTEAGYPMNKYSSAALYNHYSQTARSVDTTEIRAGDLLFYDISSHSHRKEYHIAIANGEGGSIYASKTAGKVGEVKSSIVTPKYILRILSDSETNIDYSIESGGGYIGALEDFTSLTVRDEYADDIENNLSIVEAAGFDYGYLIDLTHGGEFKFYIPEFSESAGAQWEDVNIIGRSVSIKAYSHTSSRVINISLDLYAGAGLYEDVGGNDIVGKLHKDLNFVKSLEYPDYSTAIVRPPSTVQLILGSALQIVGVVSNVTVEHMKPVDTQNRSMYVKLSFTVMQTAVNPPDYSDIRSGKYVLSASKDISSITQDKSTNAPTFTKGGIGSHANPVAIS